MYIYIYLQMYVCIVFMKPRQNWWNLPFLSIKTATDLGCSTCSTINASAASFVGTGTTGDREHFFGPKNGKNIEVSINGGTRKWMVYNENPFINGFIVGSPHLRKIPYGETWESRVKYKSLPIFSLSISFWCPFLNQQIQRLMRIPNFMQYLCMRDWAPMDVVDQKNLSLCLDATRYIVSL